MRACWSPSIITQNDIKVKLFSLTYDGQMMAELVRQIGKRCAVGSASKTKTDSTVGASCEPSNVSLRLVYFLAFFFQSIEHLKIL